MLKELVLGFDCREMWLPEAEVKNWQDKSWLLNRSAERLLFVGRIWWKSVFVPYDGKASLSAQAATALGYNLTIPVEWLTYNEYWRDLKAMTEFITHHKDEYKKRCWMICITVVQTIEYLKNVEPGEFRVPPVENLEPEQIWTLLGYDVEDSLSFTGGLGMTWVEEYQRERRELWGPRLNQYHLFSNQEDALEYATYHIKINSGIGTLLVFGLYLIQEVSADNDIIEPESNGV